MRLTLLALSILIQGLLNVTARADEKPARSIAYEEQFVWVLAERFSDDLVALQAKQGILNSDRERGEMGIQYTILYHNFLVRCDGPLPALAKLVRDVKVDARVADADQVTNAYLSALDEKSWALVNAWRERVLPPLMNTLASGQYQLFPVCVTPGFLAQNDVP